MNNLKDFLKPTLLKVTITIYLVFLVFLIGVQYYNNPIFLKVGCAPSNPYYEMCLLWGFPGIIRFESVLLLAPLYLIAALMSYFINQLIRRGKK